MFGLFARFERDDAIYEFRKTEGADEIELTITGPSPQAVRFFAPLYLDADEIQQIVDVIAVEIEHTDDEEDAQP